MLDLQLSAFKARSIDGDDVAPVALPPIAPADGFVFGCA